MSDFEHIRGFIPDALRRQMDEFRRLSRGPRTRVEREAYASRLDEANAISAPSEMALRSHERKFLEFIFELNLSDEDEDRLMRIWSLNRDRGGRSDV